MMNLWGVLLQAMEVSLVALLILVLKWLFEDKLSPRWQYGIWILLAAKLLVPSGIGGNFTSLNMAAAIDMLKTNAEGGLQSVYSGAFSPLEFSWMLPFWDWGKPVSVTDWILIIYVTGVALFLLKYAVSYGRLRAVLHRGEAVSNEEMTQIKAVAEKYNLPVCGAVKVLDIPSAFICGICSPVLVLSADGDDAASNEKVILHELLHLKYRDNLQSVFWCVLRSLNWWNPLMHYVFNRIGNDMESLCDQRVLEKLEGEERREYGKILLAMMDDKYARAPGTTSISNGGKNIARRIKAITRFKKYPKGMALVSICIVLVLGSAVFADAESDILEHDNYRIYTKPQFEMAKARLTGCGTPAGAIDTWIKGQLFDHPGYLAAASPTLKQRQLLSITKAKLYIDYEIKEPDAIDEFYRRGPFFDYLIYNMIETGDDEYEALIVLRSLYIDDESHKDHQALMVPVKVYKENTWVVEENGEPFYQGNGIANEPWDYGMEKIPMLKSQPKETEHGTLTIESRSVGYVNNSETDNSDFFFGETSFNQMAKPDAGFGGINSLYRFEWKGKMTEEERKNAETVTIAAAAVWKGEKDVDWHRFERDICSEGGGGASPNSYSYRTQYMEDGIWNGTVRSRDLPLEQKNLDDLERIKVRIYINGKTVETITLEGSDLK